MPASFGYLYSFNPGTYPGLNTVLILLIVCNRWKSLRSFHRDETRLPATVKTISSRRNTMAYRGHAGVVQTSDINKPGALSLLLPMLGGAVMNGMQIPATPGICAAVATYRLEVPYHETVTGLIVTGLLLTGLFRGTAAWQKDMAGYRREILLSRHRQSRSNFDYTIPGFYSANNRY
jgi:hypothetical protein